VSATLIPDSPETTPPRTGARAWAALGVLLLPVLLISVDMTVLGFATPSLAADLAPSSAQLLWIVDIYGFLLAGLLVTMGTLGDRIGRRRLLMIGGAGFGLASLCAAFSPTAETLIASRALLGLAGATLMPSTLSLIRNIFADRRQRIVALAAWTSAFGVGAALGPLLGGWLLEHFWWGSVFLINLPVMAVLLALGAWLIPESRDPAPGRYDLLSAALSLAAVLPDVYAKNKVASADGGQGAGTVALALCSVALGVLFGVLFVRRQRRLEHPMIDVGLFANRQFSVSVATNLVLTFALVAVLFSLTQYLQLVEGMRPLHAGMVLIPGMALSAGASFLAVLLRRRMPMASVVVIGLTATVTGFLALTQLGTLGGAVLAAGAFTLVGMGVGVTDTVTNDAIIAAAPAERAGAASAISETAYELGGALGVAVLGSALTAVYRSRLGAPDGVPESAVQAARETLGAAHTVAARLPDGPAHLLLAAADSAFTSGLQVTSVLGAIIAATAAVAAGLLLRGR
jgi:MFS transporter, DHA2 family, multidrug resistance protein